MFDAVETCVTAALTFGRSYVLIKRPDRTLTEKLIPYYVPLSAMPNCRA